MAEGGNADSVAAHLKSLRAECLAAPRYGVNGRELILQAARLVAQADLKEGAAAGPSARAPTSQVAAHPQPQQQQAYCSGGVLLDAVPPAERPFAPFVARSFLSQSLRQDCVNRLMGQFLALLLQELGLASKVAVETVKNDANVRKAAGEAALAQELRVYKDVTNKQAYQALARKTDALLKFVPEQRLASLRAAYLGEEPTAAPPAANEGAVPPLVQQQGLKRQRQHQQEQQEQDQQQQQQEHQHHQPAATIQCEKNASSGCANAQAAQAAPTVTNAARTDRASLHAAKRIKLAGSNSSSDDCHTPADDVALDAGPPAVSPSARQSSTQHGQLHDLLDELFDDDMPGGSRATGSGSPGDTLAQQQAAGPPAHRSAAMGTTVAGHAIAPAAAATAPAVTATVPAASETAPAVAAGVMREDEVRQQVQKFVAAMARPLLKSGVIDGPVFELVMARAVSKVLERHKGSTDAQFLLHECGAITKLVTSYVDFYKAK